MPVQTKHPGVYIEELPSGVHTIVGVSTSVTAFVGATRMGLTETPVRIRSVADFVRAFGPALDVANPLGHCVAHYFANGGSEAIVVRVAKSDAATATAALENAATAPAAVLILTAASAGSWATRGSGAGLEVAVDHDASNPDDLFNLELTLRNLDPRTGASIVAVRETYSDLSMSPSHPRYALETLAASQLVIPSSPATPATSTDAGFSQSAEALPGNITFDSNNNVLRVAVDGGSPVDVTLFASQTAGGGDTTQTRSAIGTEVNNVLAAVGASAEIESTAPFNNFLKLTSDTTGADSVVIVTPAPVGDASGILRLGRARGGSEVSGAASLRPAETASAPVPFTGGTDGTLPASGARAEAADVIPSTGSGGIFSLSTLLFPRFNLLCLPGITSDSDQELGVALDYCKEERAFLLVDTPPGWQTDPPDVGGLPALGEHGAIYYPRLTQASPAPGGASATLDLPPAGAVAGVYARIDAERGVWKAPAGLEAGLVGFGELSAVTDDAVSDVLNPRGVNALRTFPGAGTVVWGARTLKGDDSQSSEFKYVPVRRLTDFIASSLYLGTQFAVFEPNDPDLWAQLRLAVGTFMRGLFRQGAFQQSSKRAESDSFFVTCDETVNPQSEIDLGRVNVLVGFAPLKPAEFVVITITQISQLEE